MFHQEHQSTVAPGFGYEGDIRGKTGNKGWTSKRRNHHDPRRRLFRLSAACISQACHERSQCIELGPHHRIVQIKIADVDALFRDTERTERVVVGCEFDGL